MGGTTKSDDDEKIGQFGTGLKYAIAYLMRTETKFRLFIGTDEVLFSLIESNIAGKDFSEIYLNGESMKITTQYGYQWEAWEAIREIWCNALDEKDGQRKIVSSTGHIKGTDGSTTFYIEVTEEIKKVTDNWTDYFLSADALYEDDNVAIYPNTGDAMKLYKNHVLIQTYDVYKSLFLYDFKKADLNELRQYRGYLTSDVAKSLLGSNKAVVSLLLESIAKKSDVYEAKIDWSYIQYSQSKVKHIFNSWMFLHPTSNFESKGKSVVVSESLFKILQDSGLPCEKVFKRSGYGYGGGGLGYSEMSDVAYKEVSNYELTERIEAILFKYDAKAKFTIAVPKKQTFEILVDNNKGVIFNSELERLPDSELETIVIVAIFHTQSGDIYKAFRRLIKIVMSNRNFRKILFGTGAKNKSH